MWLYYYTKSVFTPPKISLEKDNKEPVDQKNDKDILMEISILIVIKIDDGNLTNIGYKLVRDGIVYDEA